MKKLSLLVVMLIIGASYLTLAQTNLNVHLVYDNTSLSPITNTLVQLKLGGVVVATSTTDSSGNCSFNNLSAGTYQCHPVCNKPKGSINSTDAFLVMNNFINVTGGFLTGLRLAAAEVNGIGAVPNSLDALLIVKLFVGAIPNFLPPATFPGKPIWQYETIDINATGAGTVSQQIRMICTGDVNGSYIPL
jgi:hypothetical protein